MNSFNDKLHSILERFYFVKNRLDNSTHYDPLKSVSLLKEFAELSIVAEEINKLFAKQKELKELQELISTETDPELEKIAEEEYLNLKNEIPDIEHKIKILLLPKDIDDDKGAILEIRAGTGGDEAGLFGADLFKMYEMYSALHGWKFEILELNGSGLGAIKEAIASISGKGVFARLKYESGVHRVQRVPETEASGRIHTSAATVAVLPEVEDFDIQIDEKDLQIDTYRASGAGGQHVNKTDSAVRITHIPTGTVVAVQDERSQHRNRDKAMKILLSKIYKHERIKRENDRSKTRKNQVGSGDRSERIRTYNYPQGRVSDHRINFSLYKIDKVMDASALDEIIDKLIEFDQAERLKGSND